MSLIKTLARVALGVIVYKGVTGAMNRAAPPDRQQTGGQQTGGQQTGGQQTGGGRGDLPGRATPPDGAGGLGDLLDRFGSGSSPAAGPEPDAPQRGRASEDAFANRRPGRGVPYGRAAGQGGPAPAPTPPSQTPASPGREASPWATPDDAGPTALPAPAPDPAGSFVDVLRQAEAGAAPAAPEPQHEALAALLLRAMIQAAKADGTIDPDERRMILDHLQDATEAEIAFVQHQMEAPPDPEALAAATPDALAREVWAAAALAINADQPAETDFLQRLARGLGLSEAETAQISGALPRRA